MKNRNKLWIITIIALIGFVVTACDNGTSPDTGGGNQTPVAGDYVIGNLNQMAGSVVAVTVTPKAGKSSGARTVYYAGTGGTNYPKSTVLPAVDGTYAVSFDIAVATGWNAATGLSAGILTISSTPIYGISLDPAGNKTFTVTTVGYGTQTAYSVTVNNIGNQPTGALTITLSGTNAGSFTLSKTSISSIALSGNDSFTVVPKTGLTANTYTATVTVSGGSNISAKSFTVSFAVNPSTVPQPLYVLTGSGTTFTATKDGTTVGTAYRPLQTVIDSIRDDAAGAACEILFGDGTNELNIGTSSVTFDGGTGGTDWGSITLLGKITSAATGTGSFCTIYLTNGASINSIADMIKNTAGDYNNCSAIYNDSSGTVNISGGTVSETGFYGVAIYNASSGTVNISGCTVSATGNYGVAIRNASSGTVNISGGTVSGSGSASIYAVICNDSSGTVNISGGTISSPNSNCAVYNQSNGVVTITEPPAVIIGSIHL